MKGQPQARPEERPERTPNGSTPVSFVCLLGVALALVGQSTEAIGDGHLERDRHNETRPSVMDLRMAPFVDSPRTDTGDEGWESILSEGFEGRFPEDNGWLVRRGDTPFQWGPVPHVPRSGAESGWCVGDAQGVPGLDPETDGYPNNVLTWMTKGPFSLADADSALAEFYVRVDTAPGDTLFFGAAIDGLQYWGYFLTERGGTKAPWQYGSLDFRDIPVLGNLTGRGSVWFGFAFWSGVDTENRGGVFLDDISIREYVPNPECDLSTAELEFGEVRVGQTATRSFTIRNQGTDPLSGVLSFDCGMFTVDEGLAYSVAPNETATRTVRYSPTTAGAVECVVDVGELCGSISCRGTGFVNTAPSIDHLPVQSATGGSPLEITATIVDLEDTPSARLYYRQGGATAYSSTSMTSIVDQFTAIIPGTAVTSRGIEYYLEASDGELDVTAPTDAAALSPWVVRVRSATVSAPEEHPSGREQTAYRMVSIPGQIEDASVESVLIDIFGKYDDEVWRFFRYDGLRYDEYPNEEASQFEPGSAYWLISSESGRRLGVTEMTSQTTGADFDISLAPGWNDVASPFNFEIATNDLDVPDGVDGPFSYVGSWKTPELVTAIEPWSGYAFFNPGSESVELRISPRPSPSPGLHELRKNGLSGSDEERFLWKVALAVHAHVEPDDHLGSGIGTDSSIESNRESRLGVSGSHLALDLYNFAGIAEDATSIKDPMDFVEPHPVGAHLSLAFEQADGDLWTTDFRGMPREGVTWAILVTDATGSDRLSIAWTTEGIYPVGLRALLVDTDLNRTVDLSRKGRYAWVPSPGRAGTSRSTRFRLLLGTDSFLRDSLGTGMAQAVHLAEIGPNPFSAAIDFRLDLRSESHLRLSVLDVRGRVVAVLRDGVASAGGHRSRWDGRDDRGHPVPSGVYFLRVDAGSSSVASRIIRVR